jgi:hypothetical protein
VVNLLTVSWADIIAAFPGGSGDMARRPDQILNPRPVPQVPSDGTWSPNEQFPWPVVNNTTVYMPASTDGRDVDRGLQEYYRRNGGDG